MNLSQKITTLTALALFFTSMAHAGWTSGGGELIRDARNPWFLKNTQAVDYCIEVDEANFGLPRRQIETVVSKALNNWRLDFSETVPAQVGPHGAELRIATQIFREVACNEAVPLRFQFGVLSGEQISQLGNPTKFLGIAVRTDYDPVQMRGRGFIYISPSRGPLRFESKDVVAEPWGIEDGALLYGVLLHEVGHIFGLTHTTEFGLMHERFPETLVNARSAPSTAEVFKGFPRFHVFKYPDDPGPWVSRGSCGAVSSPSSSESSRTAANNKVYWSEPLKSFYGIPDDVQCIYFSLKNNTFVVDAKRVDGSRFQLGSASLNRKDPWGGQESALSIYFPDQQRVYPGVAGLQSGPRLQARTIFKGLYKTANGKISREVGIIAQPFGMYRVSGSLNGNLIVDVDEGI